MHPFPLFNGGFHRASLASPRICTADASSPELRAALGQHSEAGENCGSAWSVLIRPYTNSLNNTY